MHGNHYSATDIQTENKEKKFSLLKTKGTENLDSKYRYLKRLLRNRKETKMVSAKENPPYHKYCYCKRMLEGLFYPTKNHSVCWLGFLKTSIL